MSKRLKCSFFALSVCLLLQVHAQQKDTLNVLFVGNSYTYFWNLPQTLVTMAEQKGIPIMARKSTVGGTTWKQHWNGDKGLKSKEIIQSRKWDVVVIQNHSMSTINHLDDFMEYGTKFIELIRKNGSTPLLYMTWSREFNPLMQAQISAGYHALGDKMNVTVASVGEVWAKARELRPSLRLYDPDSSHPSTIGTYLTSLVFFRVLTGEPTDGIPERLSTTDKNGEELYYSIMSKDDVAFLEQLVDTFELETYTNEK